MSVLCAGMPPLYWTYMLWWRMAIVYSPVYGSTPATDVGRADTLSDPHLVGVLWWITPSSSLHLLYHKTSFIQRSFGSCGLCTLVNQTFFYLTLDSSDTWFIWHLSGLFNIWFISRLGYPTPGLADIWLSDVWFIHIWFIWRLVYPTPGLSDIWFIWHIFKPCPAILVCAHDTSCSTTGHRRQ